jgi:hypothetical protein
LAQPNTKKETLSEFQEQNAGALKILRTYLALASSSENGGSLDMILINYQVQESTMGTIVSLQEPHGHADCQSRFVF